MPTKHSCGWATGVVPVGRAWSTAELPAEKDKLTYSDINRKLMTEGGCMSGCSYTVKQARPGVPNSVFFPVWWIQGDHLWLVVTIGAFPYVQAGLDSVWLWMSAQCGRDFAVPFKQGYLPDLSGGQRSGFKRFSSPQYYWTVVAIKALLILWYTHLIPLEVETYRNVRFSPAVTQQESWNSWKCKIADVWK